MRETTCDDGEPWLACQAAARRRCPLCCACCARAPAAAHGAPARCFWPPAACNGRGCRLLLSGQALQAEVRSARGCVPGGQPRPPCRAILLGRRGLRHPTWALPCVRPTKAVGARNRLACCLSGPAAAAWPCRVRPRPCHPLAHTGNSSWERHGCVHHGVRVSRPRSVARPAAAAAAALLSGCCLGACKPRAPCPPREAHACPRTWPTRPWSLSRPLKSRGRSTSGAPPWARPSAASAAVCAVLGAARAGARPRAASHGAHFVSTGCS